MLSPESAELNGIVGHPAGVSFVFLMDWGLLRSKVKKTSSPDELLEQGLPTWDGYMREKSECLSC